MIFSGLKIQIAATLFVLLAIALLLGNLVFLAFWQRAIIRTELEHFEAVLDNSRAVFLRSGSRSTQEFFNDVEGLCRLASKHCVDVAFLDNANVQGLEVEQLGNKVKSLAKTSAATRQRTVQLDGSAWRELFNRSRYLLISEPVLQIYNLPGAVVFIIKLDHFYQVIKKDQKIIFVYLLVNLLILSIVGFYRLVGLIVRPIERMIKITDTYQASDNIFFSAVKEHSEFGQLNMAMNTMLNRIESDKDKLRQTILNLEKSNQELVKAHNDVVRAEKLASVGRLSAGFAHEIGNPIGIIQGYVELLGQPDIAKEEKEQYGARALEELGRVEKLIRQLLDYAGASSQKFSKVRLDEDLFSVVLDLGKMQKSSSNVEIVTKIEPGLAIRGNREGLQQVLLNCILNAMDAIEAKGEAAEGLIKLTVSRKVKSADIIFDQALISISDNGIGIGVDDAGKQFDPFFTTKEPGKGTGLGLFVSHFIVETHGGTMRLENNDTAGATVIITLPLLEASRDNE